MAAIEPTLQNCQVLHYFQRRTRLADRRRIQRLPQPRFQRSRLGMLGRFRGKQDRPRDHPPAYLKHRNRLRHLTGLNHQAPPLVNAADEFW